MKAKKIKYPKLPPKFKAKWLKALRSKEYNQGTGKLFRDGNHCCIGIAGRVQGLSDKAMIGHGCFSTSDTFSNWTRIQKLIPDALIGNASNNSLIRKLIRMNDGIDSEKKKSFEQIANWIEQNV